jgi:hypothetical protein
MDRDTVEDFTDFLHGVVGEEDDSPFDLILYRGQPDNYPLLPTIARPYGEVNTSNIEKEMLLQLKRRSRTVISKHLEDTWDWLVYAQHFGMRTRLLDWTSNPLVALWFAANEAIRKKSDAYVYVLEVQKDWILDRKKFANPWTISQTQVLKPDLNNERILAQAGWFTAHCFSTSSKRWVDLSSHRTITPNLLELKIPHAKLKNCLVELNTMGINYQNLFPDAEGVCKHINWLAINKRLQN